MTPMGLPPGCSALRPARLFVLKTLIFLMGVTLLCLAVFVGTSSAAGRFAFGGGVVAWVTLGAVIVVWDLRVGRAFWYAPGTRCSLRTDTPGRHPVCRVAIDSRTGVEVRVVLHPESQPATTIRMVLDEVDSGRMWISPDLSTLLYRKAMYVTFIPGTCIDSAEVSVEIVDPSDVASTLVVQVYHVLALGRDRTEVHGGWENDSQTNFRIA